MPTAHENHDSDYKLLFSHPRMVSELLRDWVPGPWVEADFSTLERVNGSYVAENQKQRHDDMVWRLRLKDRWLWVYLLLEFQSEPDPWMALRMLVYVGLLSQDLVKRGELTEDGLLPPLLPLVLYNGRAPWHAPLDAADLFTPSPPGLESFRPALAYHLIDEARLKLHPADTVRSAVEALFRLEHSRGPDDLRQIIEALAALLRDPEHEIMRRTFTLWIKRLLRRKAPSLNMSDIEHIDDLLENSTMLAERLESWFDEATQKGVLQGMQQGMQEGRQEGLAEGEARILGRLLERRFGPLSPATRERLASASQTELETWCETVLTAPTLEAVFATLH